MDTPHHSALSVFACGSIFGSEMAVSPSWSRVVAAALVVSMVMASPEGQQQQESAAPLPDVETVLTRATDTAQEFAAQAKAMQARVEQRQNESKKALARQKAEFQGNLTAESEKNQKIMAANDHLRAAIGAVKASTAQIRKETESIRDNNNMMHRVLSVLDGKVTAAEQFLSDSMNKTDDRNADELEVLLPPKPLPTLDHFISVLHGDASADEGPASFMQVSLQPRLRGRRLRARAETAAPDEMNPDSLSKLLSQSLQDIDKEQKEGEAQLKAHFLAFHQESMKKRQDLLAVQARLDKEKKDLQALEKELYGAKAHVVATRMELLKRLHGMKVFSEKIDAAAVHALKSVEDTLAQPKSKTVEPTKADQEAPQSIAKSIGKSTAEAPESITKAAENSTAQAQALVEMEIRKQVTAPTLAPPSRSWFPWR